MARLAFYVVMGGRNQKSLLVKGVRSMSEMPWFYSIFNTDLLKQKAEELTKEAEKKGMNLEEYLQYKRNLEMGIKKDKGV